MSISPLTGGLKFWDGQSAEDLPMKNDSKINQVAQVVDMDRSVVDIPGPFVASHLKDDETRFEVALSVGEQCVKAEELKVLFQQKAHPICYDGFEPSGRMHIAQGILKALNVNKLTSAGCVFTFWVADWFALLNNKMGGDLKKIKRVGEYFIEVWKSCGMDMRNVRFLWASDEINRCANGYWLRVMDVARFANISRTKRCSTIMGRSEGDDQPSSQIFYPCMQCADIFFLNADICQLGMDQRRVNMLARDYAKHKKINPPVVLSHRMLSGLLEGQEKMSKSVPDTAIFMEDSAENVRRKIEKAFCPPNVLLKNPCAEYVELLVFPKFGHLAVERSAENGGTVVYNTFEEFASAYKGGSLHPGDLKTALVRSLNEMLEPVRLHFKNDPNAKQILQEISNS